MRLNASVRRAIVAFILLVILLAGIRLVRVLTVGGAVETHARETFVFGSLSTVTIAGLEQPEANAVLDRAESLLNELHRTLHPWEDSALTRLNADLARGVAHRTDATILDLIERSRALVEVSGDRFDPAIGGLIALWGFHTSDYPITTPPPDDAQIDAWLASRPKLADVVVSNDSVSSNNARVALDFNSVAEGYAAEKIAELIRATGADGALISLGGDLLALGDAGDRAWEVALVDPDGGVLGSIKLRDGEALFSSGGYGRYREVDGERWPHVLDPRDGRPARGILSTAVLSENAFAADATATALMLGGADWRALAKSMNAESTLVVDAAGVLRMTPAMQARVELLTKRRVEVEE